MERREKAEQEYQKICNNPQVNQTLINHPEFYRAFINLFSNGYDPTQSYDVAVIDKSVVIKSISNYPEATNGIYKGYESTSIYTLEIDNECLSVKEEGASIYRFPNREKDDLTYQARVTAYKNSYEVGYSEIMRTELVNKSYKAIDALNNHRGRAEINVGHALTGSCCKPADSNYYNYKSIACRRSEGIAITEYENKTNNTMIERWTGYGDISKEHPERLYGNVYNFAVMKDGVITTKDGIQISNDELKEMINQYSKTENGYSR